VAEDHVVDDAAAGFDGDALAADDVFAAGGGDDGGDAAGDGVFEAFVLRVDGVEGAKVGADGSGDFVFVAMGTAYPFFGEAEMGVAVDEAGGDDLPGSVDDLGVGGDGEVVADGDDFAGGQQDNGPFEGAVADGVDGSAADCQHFCPSGCR